MNLLQDKVIIITGGASGMGRAGARIFAKEGARVVVADLNEEQALETEREVVAAGGICKAFRYDATSSADTKGPEVNKSGLGRVVRVWRA